MFSVVYCIYSAKTPTRSAAKAIGMEARRRAKLGSILAQVHSEIIDNKTMGI